MFLNTTGNNNTATGVESLRSNTTASNNSAFGTQALYSNTTGTPNSAFGYQALYSNTTGGNNTANGSSALYNNTTGTTNTAIGASALYSNTTSADNTALGYASLLFSTGASNTAIGSSALQSNTTGSNNSALGYLALYSNTTGSNNVALGYGAGYNSGANGAYANNILLGYQAGNNITTGADNNIVIGYDIDLPTAGGDNQLNIGNIIFGTGLTGTGTTIAGNIGIGTNNPSYKLDVAGAAANIRAYANTGGTASVIAQSSAGPVAELFAHNNNRAYLRLDNVYAYESNGYLTISSSMNEQITALLGVRGLGTTTGATFATFNSSGTEKFRIQDNGNVGIGTSTPEEKLHVAGNLSLYATNASSTISTSTNGAYITLNPANNAFGAVTLSTGSAGGNDTQVYMNFKVQGTEALRIGGSTGNVSIGGDTTPDYKLDVDTDIADYAAGIFNDGNVATRSGLVIQAGLDDHTAAGPSTLVGFKDGDGTAVGSITFGSSATAYNTTSDQRLKNLVNEDSTTVSIQTIRDIKIHDFTWKDDVNNTLYSGVFAQELYNVYPHAVTKPIDETTDNWMVDYSKLTPVVIKSIQDLDKTIVSIQEVTDNTFVGHLRDWLASASNGIQKIFTKEVETENLCVSDGSGAKTCITKSQLDALLQNAGQSVGSLGGSSGDSGLDTGNGEVALPVDDENPPADNGSENTIVEESGTPVE